MSANSGNHSKAKYLKRLLKANKRVDRVGLEEFLRVYAKLRGVGLAHPMSEAPESPYSTKNGWRLHRIRSLSRSGSEH